MTRGLLALPRLALAVAAALLLDGCGKPAPKAAARAAIAKGLQVEPREQDLGEFSSYAPIPARLTLRNNSSSPVTVDRVESDCSCAVPDFKGRRLAPGEAIAVPLTISPRGQEGAQLREIRVYSGALRGGPLHASLAYAIRDHLRVHPSEIFLEAGPNEALREGVLQIDPVDYSGNVAARIARAPEFLTAASLKRDAGAGAAFRLGLAESFGAPAPDSEIVIETNVPNHRAIHVPLHASFRSGLVADPAVVRLGKISSGAAHPFTVDVRRANGREVGELEIDCPSRIVALDGAASFEGGKRLSLSITPPHRGAFWEKFNIEVAGRKEAPLRIGVIAEVE